MNNSVTVGNECNTYAKVVCRDLMTRLTLTDEKMFLEIPTIRNRTIELLQKSCFLSR